MGLDWGENPKISPDDHEDFELDLGCGTAKKGRVGIDKAPGEGVDLVFDLDRMCIHAPPPEGFVRAGEDWASVNGLPFAEGSVESIIASHVLEHIGEGFIRLMGECARILIPGGLFRIIVPLFPTRAAVIDPDHKRFFCAGSFDYFTADAPGNQRPYIERPFVKTEEICSPPGDWGEMRVSLRKPRA